MLVFAALAALPIFSFKVGPVEFDLGEDLLWRLVVPAQAGTIDLDQLRVKVNEFAEGTVLPFKGQGMLLPGQRSQVVTLSKIENGWSDMQKMKVSWQSLSPGRLWRENEKEQFVQVSEERHPYAERIGASFAVVPNWPDSTTIADSRGKTQALTSLEGRILTLVAREGSQATFEIAGRAGRWTLNAESLIEVPSLDPVLDDDPAFINKKVYIRGGSISAVPTSHQWSAQFDVEHSPITVLHCYHLAKPIHIGGDAGEVDQVGWNPRLVKWSFSKVKLEGMSFAGDPSKKDDFLRRATDPKEYGVQEMFLLSERDLYDKLSLQSMLRELGSQKAVRRLEGPTIGLTTAQVLWRMGPPQGRSFEADREVWTYNNIPFPGTVTFRDGKVVASYFSELP